MNIRQKNKRIKMQNKKLTERYPFLIPRNCFSGKVMKGYDHSYTELDYLEPGWKKAFGILICEDIRNELIKHNYLYKYRIMEIKEKYGSLRWYDNGAPGNVHDIIMKYEYISEHICQVCGKINAPMLTGAGWYEVICEKCYENRRKKIVWHKPYDECEKNSSELKEMLTISTLSHGKEMKRYIDISDTVSKIRRKYHVKI